MSQLDIDRHTPTSSHYDDQERLSTTPPKNTAKRYATYELNYEWQDKDSSDYFDCDSNNSNDDVSDHNINLQSNDTFVDSAQAARWSLPKSPPPTSPLPPIPQEQLQQNDQSKSTSRHSKKSISPINTRPVSRDTSESEPQSPYGGITVTTVKVVEILHSPTSENDSSMRSSLVRKDESTSYNHNNNDNDNNTNYSNNDNNNKQSRNSRPEPLNLSAANPVAMVVKERKQKSHMSPPPPHSTPQPPPPLPQTRVKNLSTKDEFNMKKKLMINEDPKMLKQKRRSSIMRSQKTKGSKRKNVNMNGKNGKQPEIMIPREKSFIDPRLLAQKSLVRIPSTTNRRQVKRGGSVNRKRIPLKNMEFAPTSNPVHSNDPTDMEADLPPMKNQTFPWLPGPSKPPQLLHATLIPLPHRVNRVGNASYPNFHINTNNATNKKKNVSRLFASVNPKRNSKVLSSNPNRLSRVNSQRKRASIVAPNPNRASLVFRRQILEESLMMSFGGMVIGGVNKPQPTASRPPIRRRTKKGSNAKVEDKEARRERRRKEKLERRLAEAQNNASNNSDNVNGQIERVKIENGNGDEKVTNALEVNKIIESQDLTRKVEMHKKEIYMGPQPPPRKSSQDVTMDDHFPPQRSKSNASSLLSSPPERISGKSGGSPSPTNEPPPFPTHLTRSTLFFEHTSNKERSKFKQPYSPPYSPPPSSVPTSSASNSSRFMLSLSEENEPESNVNDDELQYEIINSNETSLIQQLPSPLLTPNKSQKTGINILGGFFNKQTAKEPTSPPLSQIGSPVLNPTQLPLSPQSPTTPFPLALPTPQSPPLSPSRTLRFPPQLPRIGKSRRGTENGPTSPPAVQDPEKLRKMEQFEALIANSEISSSKKPITGKIKALITNNTGSTAVSSASSSIATSNPSFEKKKAADVTGPPSSNTNSPRRLSENNSESYKEKEQKNDGIDERLSPERNLSGRGSLTNSFADSVADSIHYRPEEKDELGKPNQIDDDGVIRVTLTPAVCR